MQKRPSNLFSRVDVSTGMIQAGGVISRRSVAQLRTDPARSPFEDAPFGFVTPSVGTTSGLRRADGLTAQVRCVLKPETCLRLSSTALTTPSPGSSPAAYPLTPDALVDAR